MALSALGGVQEKEGRVAARRSSSDRQDIKVTTLSIAVVISDGISISGIAVHRVASV
jgi:hypothetical protein